ncbi:hypothetical protein BIV60_04195 [Bacillus sp. MUM 116]|uniref:hypothetical protein n=1 Tax=Bacillus sp. MUM 116 TaxID=1678002 RepID=UPI0008F5746C|nr:hypothetical protein [Bacillus sp. MUM 116]OIK16482.1 hypothetical protein BIV60_04195 [Bacillus sp. MUM 116]
MNKKKAIIWGVIVTSAILVFNLLHEILRGHRGFAGRPHEEYGEMGQAGGYGVQGGFGGHHHFMYAPHHEGGVPWLALIIGITLLVLLVRWLRKKAKSSSMNEFIDTAMLSAQTPVMTQNARILDQWEKNLTDKKENE